MITPYESARMLAYTFIACFVFASVTLAGEVVAPKPLYRDPVYDGAADPVIVWNRAEKKWFMLYTNRRATAEGTRGVEWVHGTRIGIATSGDGANWTYEGTADIGLGGATDTHWAPDVFFVGGKYHMFLTFVPGTQRDWNHSRQIVHLTSDDCVKWADPVELKLHSDRCIDASVCDMPDGTWRLWYNDERDHKSIYWATSPDLSTWTDRGRAVDGPPGEGPKVFRWRDRYWMVVDHWNGLGVYRSDDAEHWARQPELLLATPGTGVDDGVVANHCDVVVSGDRAYVYYFTHPGRAGADAKKDGVEQRRSSIQVAELTLVDGTVKCDRDVPTHVELTVPTD